VKVRLLYLLMIVALAGCAPKMTVKPGDSEVTPTGSGPQVPSLVDVHSPVSDQDYQEAVTAIGGNEITRGNAANALVIAQYQYNKSNFNDSLKTYQKVLSVTNLSSQLEKAQYMVGQVYYDKKDYLPALAAFQTVIQKYSKSNYVSQSRQMMEFILGYSLGLEDLKRYVTNYPDSPMNCFALFQLGSREAREGMQSEAMENLNAFTDQCPQHASAAEAKLLLQSLENKQQ
jgi:outer membrane protein assembly factor BamD (BamD/ComL family)